MRYVPIGEDLHGKAPEIITDGVHDVVKTGATAIIEGRDKAGGDCITDGLIGIVETRADGVNLDEMSIEVFDGHKKVVN